MQEGERGFEERQPEESSYGFKTVSFGENEEELKDSDGEPGQKRQKVH
jgi:hypothetical protein